MPVSRDCPHRADLTTVRPASGECLECTAAGDPWFHLRWCLTCGHVGCCDDSKNKHATKHHQETGHPLIRSLDPPDRWVYCYVCGVTMPL